MGFSNLLDKLSINDVNIEVHPASNPLDVGNDDPRMQAILQALESLIHTSTCRDDSCTFGQCEKMKRIFNHARDCKLKTQRDCRICKQLIALCCFHAKNCEQTNCNVTFCSNIKEKIRVYRNQQRLQQNQQISNHVSVRHQPYARARPANQVPTVQITIRSGFAHEEPINP